MANKEDLLAALIAYNPNNYVPIDKVVLPHFELPEKAYYRKELVESLTKDAKFLIRLILNTPDELLSTLFQDNGDVRKTVVVDILKFRGWRPKKIKEVESEIKTFIHDYYGS
jgi:hypothetical protein